MPDKLEKQVRIVTEHPDTVLVYSRAVSIDEDGIELAKSSHNFNFPHLCGTDLPKSRDAIVTGMIEDKVWMPTLTVMMKTARVRSIGGFDETLKLQVEDHLLFTLLAANGPVYFIDELLAKYRVHKASYSQTTQWLYSMLEYYDRLYVSLPESFQSVITSARTKMIANDLITLKSFFTRSDAARAVNIMKGVLFDRKVLPREKLHFISKVTQNLLKQARHSLR
jgi:hypothetical protein